MHQPDTWLLPAESDAFGLLRAQAHTVDAVIGIITEWAHEECDAHQAGALVRERLADENRYRRALHSAGRAGFSAPLHPEDLFDLAERYNELALAAYALVREAHVSEIDPDRGVSEIVDAVAVGVLTLLEAVSVLPSGRAADLADRALDELCETDRAYRAAVAAFNEDTEPRRELRLRELYRRAEHVAECAVRVARRSWFAVANSE